MLSKKPVYLDNEKIATLAKTGVPPLIAELLEEKVKQLGAIALRAGSPFNRYLMPAAPKPLSVKEKTGNWGFTKGVISVDPALGKVVRKNGQWVLRHRNPNHLPTQSSILKQTVHRISLQEVLFSLNSNICYLVNSVEEIQASGRLCIKATKKFPANSDIVFSINLNEIAPRVMPQIKIDLEQLASLIHITELKPKWWQEKWGKYEDCVSQYYPAQYKPANDAKFKDIMVYGIEDRKGQVLPITGDQDLLWLSIPASKKSLFAEFNEVIDTSTQQGRNKLYEARVRLHLKLGGKLEEAAEHISNETIAEIGYITAYESYAIDEINKAFAKTGIEHLRNPFQHAPENHNPNSYHAVDPPVIHIWKNKIALTTDEKLLVEYTLQSDYLKENLIQVNSKWNMKRWSKVISMQLALNQTIYPDTKAAYDNFISARHVLAFFGTHALKKSGVQENE